MTSPASSHPTGRARAAADRIAGGGAHHPLMRELPPDIAARLLMISQQTGVTPHDLALDILRDGLSGTFVDPRNAEKVA